MKEKKRPMNYSKVYTEEEIRFMEENTSLSYEAIAKKLGRPVSGVRMKMIQLGLADMHVEMGTYSASALAEVIGVSHETVRRWILTKGLSAIKKARYYKVKNRNKDWYIRPEDFWKWAEKHKDFVDFTKIERNALPPEPAWVEEERRKQYGKPPKQKIWTPEEDQRLLYYYYEKGYTQREVAEKLGRTPSSVEKRLARLRARILTSPK